MNRKYFQWLVVLVDQERETRHEIEFESLWSPEKYESHEIAAACAAQTRYETKNNNLRYVSAQLVS